MNSDISMELHNLGCQVQFLSEIAPHCLGEGHDCTFTQEAQQGLDLLLEGIAQRLLALSERVPSVSSVTGSESDGERYR